MMMMMMMMMFDMLYVTIEKYGKDSVKPVIVEAGNEPVRFTNIFPFWQTDSLAVSSSFPRRGMIQWKHVAVRCTVVYRQKS